MVREYSRKAVFHDQHVMMLIYIHIYIAAARLELKFQSNGKYAVPFAPTESQLFIKLC